MKIIPKRHSAKIISYMTSKILSKNHTWYIATWWALFCAVILFFLFSFGIIGSSSTSAVGNDCEDSATIQETVQGTSMAPILTSGQVIDVLPSAHPCFHIERNDLVIYDYAHELNKANPVVKRVVWMPGDTFSYLSGNVFINQKKLQTSLGVDYTIDSSILRLYANDFPVIPPNKLLIFWEIPTGSKDSSTFWFVDMNELSWKVLLTQ